MELPIPLEQAPPSEISAAKLNKVVFKAVHTLLNREEYLTKLREAVRGEIENIFKKLIIIVVFAIAGIMTFAGAAWTSVSIARVLDTG
ncbi:hypothetical protein RUND412_000318 [Rhizina undulata]